MTFMGGLFKLLLVTCVVGMILPGGVKALRAMSAGVFSQEIEDLTLEQQAQVMETLAGGAAAGGDTMDLATRHLLQQDPYSTGP